MNTKSRGQSNQNGQKDKAWRIPVKERRPSIASTKKCRLFFEISLNVNLLGNLAVLCGKHCARVAGVIIKQVHVPAKFWPIVGPADMAAR
jgi:hypothetical protein